MSTITIVRGNEVRIALPLEQIIIHEESEEVADFSPLSTDKVTVNVRDRKVYSYTPRIEGNVAHFTLGANVACGVYGIEVLVARENGEHLRSYRLRQLAIVDNNEQAGIVPERVEFGLDAVTLDHAVFIFAKGDDGEDGVGIASIVETTTSTESSGINIITVTLTDGTISTFEVRNGAAGELPDVSNYYTKGEVNALLPLVGHVTEVDENLVCDIDVSAAYAALTTGRQCVILYNGTQYTVMSGGASLGGISPIPRESVWVYALSQSGRTVSTIELRKNNATTTVTVSSETMAREGGDALTDFAVRTLTAQSITLEEADLEEVLDAKADKNGSIAEDFAAKDIRATNVYATLKPASYLEIVGAAPTVVIINTINPNAPVTLTLPYEHSGTLALTSDIPAPFLVTITEEQGSYVADKTFAEAMAAYNNGSAVCFRYDGVDVPAYLFGGSLLIAEFMFGSTSVSASYSSEGIDISNVPLVAEDNLKTINNTSLLGSGDLSLATPTDLAGKADVTTLVEITATGDVSQALDSGKFYRFGEVDSLTITLTAAAVGMGIYGGKFTASANWSALALPATIDEAAGNDTIAAGKTYEFNILDNVIVVKEV